MISKVFDHMKQTIEDLRADNANLRATLQSARTACARWLEQGDVGPEEREYELATLLAEIDAVDLQHGEKGEG